MQTSVRTSLLAAALAVVACGSEQPEQAAAEKPGQAQQASTSPTLPPVTRLADWARGPFFAQSSRATYTVLSRSPSSDRGYRAWGVDVSQQLLVFNIELSSYDELVAFQTQLQGEVNRQGMVYAGTAEGYQNGSANEVDKLPPPPPAGGGGPVGFPWADQLLKIGTYNTKNTALGFAGYLQ